MGAGKTTKSKTVSLEKNAVLLSGKKREEWAKLLTFYRECSEICVSIL
jgi:hypothetical protein